MNILYVADPMCSWCYGFGPTIDALLADPGAAAPLQLSLVMGGLRPYTTEPLAAGRAEEIFSHWHHVHEASGVPFAQAPDTPLHAPGFIYDTEPASRAVVAVRTLWPQQVWNYFKAVQRAFYAEARDVTRGEVLGDLVEQQGLARAEFEAAFDSAALRNATRSDFAQAQAWGIRGFPTLLAQADGELHLLSHGYTVAGELRERLAALPAAGA